jgi:hypothetical protein
MNYEAPGKKYVYNYGGNSLEEHSLGTPEGKHKDEAGGGTFL